MKAAKTLNQNGKTLENLEAKLRFQWAKMNQAKGQDEISRLRAEAIETYQQLKKFKIMIGAA